MDFNKGNGLIPVVIQDASTHEVLMLGTVNRESWQKTLQTKRVSFWSRSRRKLWVKGETSGHTQEVKEIYLDCEGSPGFDLFENESVAGPVGTGGG